MKSIRYSVAALALLVAVSVHTTPSQALTIAGPQTPGTKIINTALTPTKEERAVSNIERAIAQKQLAKEKLQAQLVGASLGGGNFAGAVGDYQASVDSLNRRLFDEAGTLTSQEYQATLNQLNRAKSRLLTAQREAKWAQHRQDQLLREIERKNQDIAHLSDRLVDAKERAAGSRVAAIVDQATDLAIDQARESARNARNEDYALAREAVRDSERRTSVGYVYEDIQRKAGTVNGSPAPYSRASGTGRDRQGGGSDYALDFGTAGGNLQ